jgi:hypothetical protein
MKTPSRGTLSPKGERAGFSHRIFSHAATLLLIADG